MLPNLGYGELLVILVVALLLFGGNKITEVARSLGRAVNAFKAGLREMPEDLKSEDVDLKSEDVKEQSPKS